ncbi:MAG: ABC transporter ATP-binding protein [Geminicoccaceae bacterium]
MSLLEIDHLDVVIDDTPVLGPVSLSIQPGQSLGLVGESGCGKSMTALSIMGLLPEHACATGSIRLAGSELVGLDEPGHAAFRGRRVAMIFQEPMTALNPVMSIGDQIAEGLVLHGLDGGDPMARACSIMARVGLPAQRFSPSLYPHQLSGGQRQRVMIAMALAMQPELLIADEPTTALDVTVQLDILRLIRDIAQESGMALLLITHDLGVVAAMCERTMVMYAGRCIESGPTEQVLRHPGHPYTRGLLDALPGGEHIGRELMVIPGSVPRAGARLNGCAFAPRCRIAASICREMVPADMPFGAGHAVACHLAETPA